MHDLIGVLIAANFTVSDWIILLCPIPAAWFWVSFTFGRPFSWWKVHEYGWLGVVTFLHSLSVLMFLVLIVYAMFTGQRIGEPARLPIAAFLLLALVSKAVILHIERHNGHVARLRAASTEGEPMSSPTPTGDIALATVGSTPTIIPSKYMTAFLTLAVVVIAGLQSALVGGISEVEAWQFAGLVVGGVVTYIAPLLKTGWTAAVKVIGAVVGAVLAAIPPIVDTTLGGPGFTGETIVMLIFTGVVALAVQFGVDIRVDSVKKAIADPTVENSEVYVLDPSAYRVAEQSIPTRTAVG